MLALRPSLDNRMLAVQRAPCLLELVDLATGNCFVHSTYKVRRRVGCVVYAVAGPTQERFAPPPPTCPLDTTPSNP